MNSLTVDLGDELRVPVEQRFLGQRVRSSRVFRSSSAACGMSMTNDPMPSLGSGPVAASVVVLAWGVELGSLVDLGSLTFTGIPRIPRHAALAATTSAPVSERNEAFRSRIAERNAPFQSNLGL